MGNASSIPDRLKSSSKDRKMKRMHKKFMKRYPDGKMKREEFIQLYRQMCRNENLQHLGEHMFRSFDADNDNQVSFEDLVWSFSITSRGTTEEKLRWSFPIYDLDRDGYVTIDEVIEVMRRLKCTKHKDKDEDIDLGHVAEMFMRVDTDNNGCWSVDEFVEGMQKDPELVKMLSPTLTAGSRNSFFY